jgi:hypothetical protein
MQKTLARLRVPLTAVLLAGAAAPAAAHDVERTVNREIVRLQGHPSSDDAPADGSEIVLVVFGEEIRFRVGDWQVFAFTTAPEPPRAGAPARLTLEGDRATLARVAEARREQRLTLLAERRPGAAEVFVLALDVCPE